MFRKSSIDMQILNLTKHPSLIEQYSRINNVNFLHILVNRIVQCILLL